MSQRPPRAASNPSHQLDRGVSAHENRWMSTLQPEAEAPIGVWVARVAYTKHHGLSEGSLGGWAAN